MYEIVLDEHIYMYECKLLLARCLFKFLLCSLLYYKLEGWVSVVENNGYNLVLVGYT